jgi:pimeloyl-ACP methyl ester carboxylesterase
VVTVVLVHGGFLGPAFWSDVADALGSRGVPTVLVDLPSMGIPTEGRLGDVHADAREVRRVLDSLEPPVLLCGHSYGGAVITEAASGAGAAAPAHTEHRRIREGRPRPASRACPTLAR